MVHNRPNDLIFVMPGTLPPGSHRIEVRALYGTDDLRGGRLNVALTT